MYDLLNTLTLKNGRDTTYHQYNVIKYDIVGSENDFTQHHQMPVLHSVNIVPKECIMQIDSLPCADYIKK